MVRLTFRSPLASEFTSDTVGGYTKLIVPPPGNAGPPEIDQNTFKASMRTYTIQSVRAELDEFDVDFVVHGDAGIVGPWARQARPGDRIAVSRPGALKLSTKGADWFRFAADLSALPAAAAVLATLPDTAIGEAFFEIPSEADRQDIVAPKGITQHWIVKPEIGTPSDELIAAFKAADWHDGEAGIFVAGEFSMIGELRSWLRATQSTRKELTYISSYWKLGLNEIEHKRAKAQAA